MTARRTSVDELIPLVRAVAATYAPPGVLARRVVIHLSDGTTIETPVSPVADETPAAPSLDALILDLVAAADRPLKGTVIAAKLGRPYGSTVRETLARMVAEGQLQKAEGGGYEPGDE